MEAVEAREAAGTAAERAVVVAGVRWGWAGEAAVAATEVREVLEA